MHSVVMATKLFNNIKEMIARQELHLVVIATKMFKVIAFKDFSFPLHFYKHPNIIILSY